MGVLQRRYDKPHRFSGVKIRRELSFLFQDKA
jgi:hypothetical protein